MAEPSSASPQLTHKPASSQQASKVLQALQDLNNVHDQFVQASLSYNPSGCLTFLTRPSESGQYNSQDGVSRVNSGHHALDLWNPKNWAHLQQETTLCSLLKQLNRIPGCNTDEIRVPCKSLVDKIQSELHCLDHIKEQEWEHQHTAKSQPSKVSPHPNVVDTSMLFSHPLLDCLTH